MEKQHKIKILQDLIKINSVNGNEREVAEYLANLLDSYGIKNEVIPFSEDPKRANLIAEIGSGKRVFGLTGHQDTVAVVDENKWKFPPFSATIDGDRIYGRGAADMKSGLAAEVIALIEMVETGNIPNGKVRLIITAGEEFGAPGAYKVHKDLISDLDALIVGEATNGDITYAHSGSFNYQINSLGKAVHSSIPNQGVNAINGLVTYINAEQQMFEGLPKDDVLGEIQHSVTVINGGDQINTIPSSAYLLGNVRPTSTFNNQQIQKLIESKVELINETTKYQLEFKLLHNFYPMKTDLNNDLVESAYRISQAAFPKRKIKRYTDNGASDASVFVQVNNKMPVIILGPDKENSSHQVNEHTTISSYLTLIKVYQKIISKFFADKKSS